MFELVQNEAPGDAWTIYSSEIPSVTQTPKMISMDVGEDVNIPIEGIVSSLSKIINDYVSEIDLSHLLLFYALLIKWRSITIYPLFKQLNHQIISICTIKLTLFSDSEWLHYFCLRRAELSSDLARE